MMQKVKMIDQIIKIMLSNNQVDRILAKLKKPCQAGYEQYGMKMKNGRKVPNCVPIKRK